MTAAAATAPPPPPRRTRRPWPRRLLRALAVFALLLLTAAGTAALWLRSELRASLPRLEGEVAAAGLAAPVAVERDAQGVPTVRAASRRDAAFALGFLHAQDRFFQMVGKRL